MVIADRDRSLFFDRPATSYLSASGGLSSTAGDYLKFEQMLVNGGAFGTRTWTDPEEELTAVPMLQQPYRPARYDFENAVQQAIID